MRLRAIFSAMIIIMVAFLCSCNSITQMNDFIENPQLANPNLNLLPDGIYEGEFDSGMVSAKVQVQTVDHRYSNISIINHETLLGSKAETIVDAVIEQQSLEVDVVTGATVSSLTILKAIETAIDPGN